MNNPLRFAESAVGVVLGRDQRDLNEMTIPDLEAKAKLNEERLRLARQAGWLSGFGGGFLGVVSAVKMMR